MSWDLFRIYWPNAAMPFALALMPLIAFTEEWQTKPAQTSWVHAMEYQMDTVPSSAVFDPPTNNLLAASLGSGDRL